MDEKVFNDPVHGTICLRPELVKIINTPQFQRLRNIKQLGGTYFVYPGASHNRFEHSIGTAYLAGKLVRHLKENQDLGIDDRDVLCVEIAGLCHDLGHGPFSHLYDGMFKEKLIEKGVIDSKEKFPKHEIMSCNMLDLLLDGIKNEVNLETDELKFIKEMIVGKEYTSDLGKSKPFLYEIISNKINGVDVDKWDYFARDCHHLGIPNGFDHNRFMQFMRVIKVEKDDQNEEEEKHICVHEKECFNLYEMFHTRCSLHRRAYQHKVANAIEHMISDALIEADKHILTRGRKVDNSELPRDRDWQKAIELENGCLKVSLSDPNGTDKKFLKDKRENVFYLRTISQCVDDPEAFTRLDDGIFQQILHSDGEHLKKAREILERIFRRDIYICIRDEQLKKLEKWQDVSHKIKEQIVDGSDIIGMDDLEVSLVVLNYGDDGNNPVAKYRFYSKNELSKTKEIKPCEFSNMLPAKFEEKRIQVFCKDPKNVDEVKKCFKAWNKK